MLSPRISVYITSYNQKEYLAEAIESVLNQTLKPFEIIIVDDCSTDGSQEIIADYALRYHNLIKPIYHDQNMGIASTRNTALRVVEGDYVTFVDGDDRFLPNKIEKECQLLQINPDAHLVFSNFFSMTAEGRYNWLWAEKDIPPEGDIFYHTVSKAFPRKVEFRNEMVNYDALKSTGFYDTKLIIYEDYELRIRLTKKYRAVYNPEPASEYRRHEKGISAMDLETHLEALNYIYRKNYHLLSDLPQKHKKQVIKNFKLNIANLLRRAAIGKIHTNKGSLESRILALKFVLRSLLYCHEGLPLKLVFMILAPYKLYLKTYEKYLNLKST